MDIEKMEKMVRVAVDRVWREKNVELEEGCERMGKSRWKVDGDMVREESMEELMEMGEWGEWEVEMLEEWVDKEVRGWEEC